MTNPVQKININQKPVRLTLTEMREKQNQQRGFEPLPLEPELLLTRIKQGGYSGQFLADAFISMYRTATPFPHSLGGLIKLDDEAIRLFHGIIHARFITGWDDNQLYNIEQNIINYQSKPAKKKTANIPKTKMTNIPQIKMANIPKIEMDSIPIPAQLPATGYIRLATLLKFVPYSRATIWRKLKDPADPLPRPVNLGTKILAWHVDDIRTYLDSFVSEK